MLESSSGTYWADIMYLPQGVFSQINNISTNFCGRVMLIYGSLGKVAWATVFEA